MEKIQKKLKELEELLTELKKDKKNPNAQQLNLITNYIRLASSAANFRSRVTVNKMKPKTEEKPKAKRGRPKKKDGNLLATSTKPKTLKDKLNKDLK